MIAPKVRKRHYYSVERAGALVGWTRAMAYIAARRGDMPIVRDGRLMLVPRAKWDRQVERLLSTQHDR